MKIPSSVKIGGHEIVVETVDETFPEPDDLDSGIECLGFADKQTNKIILALHHDGSDIAESRVAETLMHEIVHHVDYIAGLDLAESQVAALSELLFQVFRENDLDFRKGI